MDAVNKNEYVKDIFTRHSHHENLSLIFTTQNYFSMAKNSTSIKEQLSYMVFMKAKLNQRVLATVCSQHK